MADGASTAGAQAPRPSVSTASGTVTPAYLSGSEAPRSGEGPSLVKDGFGIDPPSLGADAGSLVTITLAAPADAVVAYLGPATLAVAPTGDRTYAVTVPEGAPLPARLVFRVEASTETTLFTDAWLVNLGGTVADPVPPERVARVTFGRLVAGTRTTLRTTVRAAARRHLRQHRVRSLRVVLTPVGGQPLVAQLALSAGGS